MPLTRTHRTTARPRRSLFNRRSPRHHATTTTTTTTTTRRRGGLFSKRPARAPVHHQKRKPTMKDKVSGALLKLKGSLTHRPAVKVSDCHSIEHNELEPNHLIQAAGTRRMHGTDGRGSHRRHRM